jgi:Flp pilus assembly protein TadD
MHEGAAAQPGIGIDELRKRAKYHLSKENWTAAEHDFTRIIELAPQDPIAHFALACVLARQRKDALALDYLDRSIALGFRNREVIMGEPALRRIQSHARFRSVLAKLNR